MLVIDASQCEVVEGADTKELLHQNFLSWRSGTWQHLDFIILGAESFPTDNISHVVLSDHGGLKLGQVVPIPLQRLIKISSILYEQRELIDGHLLDVRVHGLDHGMFTRTIK